MDGISTCLSLQKSRGLDSKWFSSLNNPTNNLGILTKTGITVVLLDTDRY